MDKDKMVQLLHKQHAMSDRFVSHMLSRNIRIEEDLIAVIALGGSASAQSRRDDGSRVTVYADINFGGQSASFGNNTPNMASAGWNDNVSSIRIPSGESTRMCRMCPSSG